MKETRHSVASDVRTMNPADMVSSADLFDSVEIET